MTLLDHAPASFDEYVVEGGGRGLERALSMPQDEVIDEVTRSGLRGRGGAGFPTGVKWRAVRSTGTGRRYVVCNAAEGEPATFKDRLLMRRNPYRVLDGLAIAAYAVRAPLAYIVLKDTFARELESVAGAVEEMRRADALPVEIQVMAGPDHYLLGEETGLLEAVEGRSPLPRTARPFMLGLFAQPPDENPTLVNNVETLANVPDILLHGADRFRDAGTQRSPGTMLFTVVGDVEREGVYELPLGTPLRRLIEDAAGRAPDGRPVKVVFPGSSSTAILEEQLDTPLDFDSMRQVGSSLGAGGFAVYDDSTCIVEAALPYLRFLHVESCGQCPPCKLHSADIVTFLERLDRGEEVDEIDVALQRARVVTDGQKCALPTGTSLLAQSVLLAFGEEIRRHRGVACPSPRGLVLPKITDLDEERSRFSFDLRYARKRADWTYARDGEAPSEEAPVAEVDIADEVPPAARLSRRRD